MPSAPRRRAAAPGVLVRQTVLYTGAVIAVPLMLYPRRLGFPSLELNPTLGVLEWGFYLGVFVVAGLQVSWSTRIVAAGFTVLYRLLTGVFLGTLIVAAHGRPWGATMFEMMWSYPLAVIPQVLLAPIVLRPVWERLLVDGMARGARRPVTSQRRVVIGDRTGLRPSASAARLASTMPPTSAKPYEPSLDDAVSYVGEYDGVRMSWIVDGEGLPLAVWQRQQYTGDADFWAPVAVEMTEFHRRRLSAAGPCRPERVEVRTDQGRVIVEAVGGYWLGVLTDPDADELINLRLGRAREMAARSLQENGRRLVGAGEVRHV
ncbi:MAG: hypothetical protein AB1792_06580 [Candidatus Zixiibacteriota bacterium]